MGGSATRRTLEVAHETWPIRGVFTISRGSRSEAHVVTVTLREGTRSGRGECVPYPRYGESVDSVLAQIEQIRPALEDGLGHEALAEHLPPGAARNAIDCALWDLAAKRAGQPVWRLAGLEAPRPVVTAYTLSVDAPERMEEAARANAARPLLKLKLAGEGDVARLEAVRRGAPVARLIVDANEAWTPPLYTSFLNALTKLGVELIEQPFRAEDDGALAQLARPIPVCADESCHDRASLARLVGRYDVVNLKLDKTGGLSEALALRTAARAAGFRIMVGCMVGTSLGIAPAFLLAQGADWVDLDAPLLLARDRQPAISYLGSVTEPPRPVLWG